MTSLAAFTSPAFRRYQLVRVFSVLALQMQGVAVAWQVYSITGSPLDLGLVGLVQFLPNLLLFPITGTLIDRHDRRTVMALALVGFLVGAVGLWLVAKSPSPSVGMIYTVLVLVSMARAFAAPAGQALLPQLVPGEHFPNAVTWSSTLFHLGAITGPAIGGLVYAAAGPTGVYATCAGLLAIAVATILTLRPRPAAPAARPGWRELGDGIRFVWREPVILGAISLDLFAVLLGGAVALLPIYARDILEVGPEGLGLLRGAPALGAIVMALTLSLRPIRRHAGLTMFGSVAVFGLATVVFGLSSTFWISLVALAVAGAADEISVVIRHTVLQLRTPDAMRGRVSAVSFVFIGMSNEIGELESGVAATLIGVVPAVVLGGVGTLVVVALGMWLAPALRRVDELT